MDNIKENSSEYISDLHKEFGATDNDKRLFARIASSMVEDRDNILQDVQSLIECRGFSYAVLALFRQQVNCGFVVADPLLEESDDLCKTFFDPDINIPFKLQWNQYREFRRHHDKLINLGIISEVKDKTKLVNPDKDGKACYLCKENIEKQNPREILLEIELAGKKYYLGANFAFITNNHFTVMNSEHISQRFRSSVIEALNDFVHKCNGYFRAIFNGLAGASIKEHEHLQATTEPFPIENICVKESDIVYKDEDIKVSTPEYYIPVWLVEGYDKSKVNIASTEVVTKWLGIYRAFHTVNLISTMSAEKSLFRVFIILRDKRKLSGGGKRGAMAAFESGGRIILSCGAKKSDKKSISEKEILETANLVTVKQMLKEIAPDSKSVSSLSSVAEFKF